MHKDPSHFSWDMLLSGYETPVKIRDTLQGENALAHTHDFIEIVMVHHGKGTHISFPEDDTAVSNTIIKGDVFVLLPGEKHAYADCRRFGVYNICVRKDFFTTLDDELKTLQNFNKFFIPAYHASVNQLHLLPETFYLAHKKIRTLVQAVHSDSPCRTLAIRLALTDFIFTVFGKDSMSYENSASGIAPELFQSIILLEEHPERRFDLPAVAKQAGMSTSGYSHKFKQVTGVSPGDYCLFLKLDKARKLLENKALPLTDVALQCGFSDSNYLIRAFKKRFGMPPGKFRNKIRVIDA